MIDKSIKPIFGKDSDAGLYKKLKTEVADTVNNTPTSRRKQVIVKAFIFPLLYIGSYIVALTYGNNIAVLYSAYVLMGVLLVANFLNVIHEAIHHSLFKNKKLNDYYQYLFDIMGANSYIWKVRHLRLHHTYPNVLGWDSDFEQSPMARVFPSGKYLKIHKYQHIYLPFLYPLYLFNWLLVRDFKDFFNRKRMVWKVNAIPAREYAKLILFKLFFIYYIIFLPYQLLHISFWVILGAFIAMMFTASLISLMVLLSPHASVHSTFPMPDEENNMPHGWLTHQLSCTNDVNGTNWFTRFFMGNFNFHIAHHLFPNVSHVYYPEITGTIKQFARQNQLPYRSYSLLHSLKSHYLLLKQNAFGENIFEETM